MDIVKCEAFLSAAEGGSFSAAATAMGYTQPGITRMIDSLEEELGFTLSLRTKRGVSLTPNGEEMLPRIREIVRAHRAAEETGADIRGLLSGVLTIGCYYSVSSMLLPVILKSFLHDYPGVRVILKEGTTAELSRSLTEHSVDCAFAAKPTKGTVCDWIPVMDDELNVWLPAGHPESGCKRFPVKKLADYPFIITQRGNDTDIDRVLSEADIQADIRFQTKDAYTTFRMVEAGLGISMNQTLISSRWEGNVVTIPFDPPQYVHMGIAVPSLKEAPPAVKKIIEYITATRHSY